MPIFEYICDDCEKRFSALVGVLADAKPPACPRCGSASLTKQVSRFARLRSEDEAMENLADPASMGDVENDPKAMRKWVREMGNVIGEDLDEEFEEMVEDELSGKPEGGGSDETIY